MKLRSVEIQLPRADEATRFLCDVWLLHEVERRGQITYLNGSGQMPYLLSLQEHPVPAVASITFEADAAEIDALRARALQVHAESRDLTETDEPGAASGIEIRGPERQLYRFVSRSAAMTQQPDPASPDIPVQLTHVVLNTSDLQACEQFATDVLGFHISDRTRIMTFVRCNRKHHCIAYAPAPLPSLNHIAFEMQNTDAVMRGIGRLKDAGISCSWGPGRHGPGNNVFAYFIAPFGGIIEYTSEVSEVDSSYRVGAPSDWTWPPGRIDQWGVSQKDVARITAAERLFQFQ